MHPRSAFVVLLAATVNILPHAVAGTIPKPNHKITASLQRAGNAEIKATIINNIGDTISLLKFNTFLTTLLCAKQMSCNTGNVPFRGINQYFLATSQPHESFKLLAPGETAEVIFDVGETSDLSAGVLFSIYSEGTIPFAYGNDTTIAGTVTYKTNTLDIEVNGPDAAAATVAHSAERYLLHNPTRNMVRALKNCVDFANQAGEATRTGDATKFKEYFHSTREQDRKVVSERFCAIARECASSNSGWTYYCCTDQRHICKGGMIAYEIGSEIFSYPNFFKLAPVAQSCHDPDQGYVVLHEMTHIQDVYSPPTTDYVYGYEGIRKLSREKALLNADTFPLYAAG
ncbi:hypothetical protein FQN57_001201 [Myotisia sp. PD_48]|nr:hypothetical protein FQN57_001201 [Myotisia sp. PD_48]